LTVECRRAGAGFDSPKWVIEKINIIFRDGRGRIYGAGRYGVKSVPAPLSLITKTSFILFVPRLPLAGPHCNAGGS